MSRDIDRLCSRVEYQSTSRRPANKLYLQSARKYQNSLYLLDCEAAQSPSPSSSREKSGTKTRNSLLPGAFDGAVRDSMALQPLLGVNRAQHISFQHRQNDSECPVPQEGWKLAI